MIAYLLQRSAGGAAPADTSPNAATRRTKPWPALERARRTIDEQFDRCLDLDTLSSLANCSLFHFVRAFRGCFNETPHRYQMRRRVERAQLLLTTTTHSVTEICFEIGFESLGSFSSRFRQITGRTPTVYRARSRAQRRDPERFVPYCYLYRYGLPLGARRPPSDALNDAERPALSNSREADGPAMV